MRRTKREHPDINAVSDWMAQFIESITHVDIIQKLKTEHGYWMTLDDALIECEIEAGKPTWQGSPQTASNMAEMEIELLNG